MPDKAQQKYRTNRVFKTCISLSPTGALNAPYFVCLGAVGAFNLFNSILAGIVVFIGGFAYINLYAFWNETAFLAKSGDLGMVLSIPGVDY